MDTYKITYLILHSDSQSLGRVSLTIRRTNYLTTHHDHYSYTLHLRRQTTIVPLLTRSEPPDDEEAEKADFNPVVSGL